MEQEIMSLLVTAIACAAPVTGITQVIKNKTSAEGLQVIIIAVITGILLLTAIGYIANYPIAESILIGVLSGFASVGAFESVKHIGQ